MRVAVIGTGYVGLVSGACLAELGHRVTCVDVDAGKIERLKGGEIPIFEPGLEELVRRNVENGRLTFTTSFAEAIPDAEAISIAVGTPSAADGSADMRYVDAASEEIGRHLSGYAVIATKSTVPVGTSERVTSLVAGQTSHPFDVVSNPETLREGRAVYDFLHPSRIIIGVSSERAADVMTHLFAYLDCPKVVTDPRSAELTKYAANAFLATKISFINEMSHLCEDVGADVEAVAKGMGLDPRIGKDFLRAGLGWGGSCFPKDVRALSKLGESVSHPLPVVNAAIATNRMTRTRVVDRLEKALGGFEGKTVAVLGRAFKDNTDDTRESAAVDIVKELARRGATVRADDPVARVPSEQAGFDLVHAADPYEAAQGAHAAVLATEWEEFRTLDLARLKSVMAGDVLMDGRNLLKPDEARAQGFRYLRVGKRIV
ncbi:MAG: UDP-glucose/GDP-mannose dehydrogenase family protein [Patescibacteria group bacterium]